jgi:hypothetical protein
MILIPESQEYQVRLAKGYILGARVAVRKNVLIEQRMQLVE